MTTEHEKKKAEETMRLLRETWVEGFNVAAALFVADLRGSLLDSTIEARADGLVPPFERAFLEGARAFQQRVEGFQNDLDRFADTYTYADRSTRVMWFGEGE